MVVFLLSQPLLRSDIELLADAVLLVEAVDASAGLGSLLLTGVEGMALGADLDVNVLLGRTGDEAVAAVACHCCLIIIRMNTLSHTDTSLSLIRYVDSLFHVPADIHDTIYIPINSFLILARSLIFCKVSPNHSFCILSLSLIVSFTDYERGCNQTLSLQHLANQPKYC